MKQGIIIGAQEKNKDTWLKDLINSMEGCVYPYKVHYTNDFELSSVKWAMENTDWDEILFFPESTVIRDLALFDKIFKDNEGKSVSICSDPVVGAMYLMKYRRAILKDMEIPIAKSKRQAVELEVTFNPNYAKKDETVVLFPEIKHSNDFVHKYGRMNMIMGNEYIARFKGSWGQYTLDIMDVI